VELTWLERREGVEDRRHERLEERVVLAMDAAQKLTVRDACPATAHDGVDNVALERCGEVERKLLVKKNAH
jgi:hypothetical protein